MKVGIVSLGCDKNRCNTETMLHYLQEGGYEITNNEAEAEILVVNTCAFIESARVEAVETILEMAELKKNGTLKTLIVSGCLPEKYIGDIFNEFIEVDGFLGVRDYPIICDIIKNAENKRVNAVHTCTLPTSNKRVLTTPAHYGYLMIADGCDNHCTYCTIPQIRGRFVSRKMEELIDEAKTIVADGVKEIILVAQDVTSYGIDLYNRYAIVELIQELSKIEYLKHIRLLYCYPEKVTDELLEEIAHNEKVVKYMDIPLQHASTAVLKRMGRFGTYEGYLDLFNKIKAKIPEIAIRSTVMVGFPGETEEDFENLVQFLEEVKPVNCGVFAYSDEEDAPSKNLPNKVDDDVKTEREYDLIEILSEISQEFKEQFIGKTMSVVYEEIDFDNDRFIGRCYISAPDIDSLVFFTSTQLVEVGESYDVTITGIENDDLIGEIK